MGAILHTAITKMPRCRWCDKEPEFSPTAADLSVCHHCGAMQSPLLNLRSPAARLGIQLYVNPDDGLFLEVLKQDGSTARYTLSPERLKTLGALFNAPVPLNGKKVDRGL